MLTETAKTQSLKKLLDRCSGHTADLKNELCAALGVHWSTVHRWYQADSIDEISLVNARQLVCFINEKKVEGLPDITLEHLFIV